MSKTKITLAAIGGVSGVAVIAAGVFAWLQISARTAAIEGDDEGTAGLETVQAKADSLLRQAVRPCEESVKELVAARDEIQAWREETFRAVARGDRAISNLTDAAFKEFLIQDAKRLLALPEGTTNKTLDASFEFGPFKPYIAEGKMPEADVLRKLQRNWDDFALIVETLSGCGVVRVTSLDFAKVDAATEDDRPAKGKKNKKSKKTAAEPTFKPATFTYIVTCQTRAAAFVKALNAFQTIDRFVVVDDFVIRRGKDSLAEALGGDKKDEAASASRRGRRRGTARVEEVEEKKADDTGIVIITDPQRDAPFEAVLTLTIHDFKSQEEAPNGEEVEK